MSNTLHALNPDDPTGPPIQVRLPDEIVSIVCPDCDVVVGGGDPRYATNSYALRHPCPFCGKGPPVITSGEERTMSDEKNEAEPSGASGGSQRVAIERLLEMARRGHYYCEDSWYSCPLAEDGCANDSYAKDECRCGASEHNAKVDEIAATLRPLLERLS